MRDPVTKKIVRDPERFDLVRRLFALRLQRVPVLELVRRAKAWGLTTRRFKTTGGLPLFQSQMYRLLSDKFYAGIMVSKGVEYRGSYEAMVTLKEYEEVQALNAGKAQEGPRTREREFTYRGLIRCGTCKALVTREEKTNRYGYSYTYYHCCGRNRVRRCREPSVELDEVERQVTAFLGTLSIPQDFLDYALKRLPEEQKEKEAARQLVGAQLAEQLKGNSQRLTRLRQLCVDGVIGPDELVADRSKLFAEEQHLHDKLALMESESNNIEPLRDCFSFVNEAPKLFQLGTSAEKRAILQSVVSNLSLQDKTLLIEAKKPFSLFQQRERFPSVWACLESNQGPQHYQCCALTI